MSEKSHQTQRPNYKTKVSVVTGTIRKVLRDGAQPVSTKSHAAIKPEPTFGELQAQTHSEYRFIAFYKGGD